jgi:hypothetical protein
MLSRTSFAEKRIESVVAASNGFVRGHLAVWLDTMFKAEQLPTCIPDLDTCLTDMDTEALTHGGGLGRLNVTKVAS